MFQHFRTITNNRCPFHRILQLTILHPPCFRCTKHKLTTGNIDLPPTKVHRINPLIHRSQNFFRVILTIFHKRIGHTRHRCSRITFTSAITCGLRSHQTRIGFILQISGQNPIFNQYRAPCGIPLIINIQRTASIGNIALVNHRYPFCRHALANTSCKCAGTFTVKIAFQTMPHRFMQQHPRPTITQHHRHRSRRCRTRFQIR